MIKLSTINPNPDNPRVLKDEKFEKLCKSINEFPEMFPLRPIVIDETNTILGGNMRFRALQHLGFKEVQDNWIIKANELTEEQKKRFIITDNVSFGEWDFYELANNWDAEELKDWGVDIPNWAAGVEQNEMTDDDVDIEEEFDPIGVATDLHKVVFIFDDEDKASNFMAENLPKIEFKRFGGGSGKIWQVNLSEKYGKK